MRRKAWGSLITILAITVLLSLFAVFSVSAATARGTFGEDGASVSWLFDSSSGTLTISGKGAMADASLQSVAPWYDYHGAIRRVVVSSGVTSIGNYAFRDCSALTTVSIATSVTEIGEYAFYGCSAMTDIWLSSTVTSIGSHAFANCSSLESIELSKNLATVGAGAFYGCTSLNDVYFFSAKTSIAQSADTVCQGAKLYGYAESTAKEYASAYGREFALLPSIHGVSADGLSWELTVDGELVISGDGDMSDYPNNAPWMPSKGGVETFDAIDEEKLTAAGFNDSGALVGFYSSISSTDSFSVISDGNGKYIKKEANTAATINLLDSFDFIKNEKFIIAFDYRMEGLPNSGGILSLNTRALGENDEMRILSTKSGQGGIFFGQNGMAIVSGIDYNTPTWISFCVIVDPITYNYEIYVNGKLTLYTVTKSEGGHIIYVKDENGAFVDSGVTMSQSLSPFTNLSGQIDGIYFFHYVNKGKMIDNITVRTVSEVADVVVANGVENIGANAFSCLSQVTSATVAATVSEIGEEAFASTALSAIRILSSDVVIFDSADTIPATATIYGYSGSTAASYAEKYGRTFVAIN